MCGSGIEDYYVQIMEQKKQDEEIEQLLFAPQSFVKISLSTFSLFVPSKN
jgi:hypothetical protein